MLRDTYLWSICAFITVAHGASENTLSSVLSVSTCPFKTVNYITHMPPQQCLATGRLENSTSPSTTTASTSAISADSTRTSLSDVSITVIRSKPTASSIDLLSLVATTITSSNTDGPAAKPTQEPAAPNEVARVVESLDEESALESGNFLSFEEWKKQNLKKVGQSEHVGRRGHDDVRQRPSNMHTSLDTLGEDGEIDIDFSGFVPDGPEKPVLDASQPVVDSPTRMDGQFVSDPRLRGKNKDAGTTCKERFNYASFDCAANVHKTNKGATNDKAVLMENKDTYMLNRCSQSEKFIVLELCNDILIDTIVLANFEFFSSTFRTFKVSVSDRYPVKADKWKTLGTYEARNTREIQAFLVENPIGWMRYVRIDLLTQYGNEFYCPVSLIRVHGTTMMEHYRHEMELSMDPEDDEVESNDEEAQDKIPIAEIVLEAVADSSTIIVRTDEPVDVSDSKDIPTPKDDVAQALSTPRDPQAASAPIPASQAAMEAIMSVIGSSDTCLPSESPTAVSMDHVGSNMPSPSTAEQHSPGPSTTNSQVTASLNTSQNVSSTTYCVSATPSMSQSKEDMTGHSSIMRVTESSMPAHVKQSPASVVSAKNTTVASTATSGKLRSSSQVAASEGSKSSSSTKQSHPAIPSTQESFFTSVQKRLQMLEANSSLSLQYIEDQSRALRDAFKKVEQRQLTRTTVFLQQLNQTVLNELREFRQQYDQLWQSTVIELDLQRERYEQDNKAINARIGILANEVIFQRRMAIMQMILILVCLVLVLFSRGAINNYLELPIVQNVLSKSPSSRWLNLSSDSLLRPAQPVRTRSANQLRAERTGILKSHERMQSEDLITDNQSGDGLYAPPTPVSDYEHPEGDLPRTDTNGSIFESDTEVRGFADPNFDPSSIERPATSPPTQRVKGDSPVRPDMIDTSEEESISTRLFDNPRRLPNENGAVGVLSPNKVPIVKRLSWKLPEG